MDVRVPRQVKRISDAPATKAGIKHIYDQGFYSINKKDSRGETERKVRSAIMENSFSFILNGNALQGRFAIKRMTGGFVIQKFKDKYATEEDVLSADLTRTISTMIPDYDESNVTLERPKKRTRRAPKPLTEPEEIPITADTVIGRTTYHFAFYSADGEPEICLITSVAGRVLVLAKVKNKWVPLSSMKAISDLSPFIEHASDLKSIL